MSLKDHGLKYCAWLALLGWYQTLMIQDLEFPSNELVEKEEAIVQKPLLNVKTKLLHNKTAPENILVILDQSKVASRCKLRLPYTSRDLVYEMLTCWSVLPIEQWEAYICTTFHALKPWTTLLGCGGLMLCIDWMMQGAEGVWNLDRSRRDSTG